MNKPDWPKLDMDQAPIQGFLVDRQIRHAISRGQLINEGAKDASAKYASYEVHIGPSVKQLVTLQAPGSENDLYREKIIPEDGVFRINPGETFKIYAAEGLNMPADVFAITIPVGNMYKLGLNPETTFADPGFAGPFYVTVCNYSPRVVKLRVGDPLARVFFFSLAERPDEIHESRPREIPPSIERVSRPSIEDLREKGEAFVLKQVLELVDPPHFEHAFVTQSLVTLEREATGSRLRDLDRKTAVLTILNLASLLIVLFVGLAYIGSFLRTKWPELFGHVFGHVVGAFVIWASVVFLIRPVRGQFLDSIATLRKKP